MLTHFTDVNIMSDVLRQAQTGLWAIEIDEGKAPRMYVDSAMQELLGLQVLPDPEACYSWWYDRIVDEYYPVVQAGVEKITNDERAEVQYAWLHPEWGRIYIRCGGVRNWNYKDGVCLHGYHQNITNTVILRQEYDAVIRTLSQSYFSILLCNLKDKSYRIIKISKRYEALASGFTNYEHFFRFYVSNEVAIQFREVTLELARNDEIKQRFANGDKQIEIFYHNIYDRWQRLRIVPTNDYCEAYPWVIAAFDEQDGEMERRLNDASARAAMAQIYTLVISVNLERTEYNCIYNSDRLLRLSEQGSFAGFYGQITQRMPSEDRRELDKIFDRYNYHSKSYLEGGLRIYDTQGGLHYYTYYSARIRQGIAERILLTIRNIDDQREEQLRSNVLSKLCQCYYSIYLFDLENNTEEAIWQELAVKSRFPKGNLKKYYDKFIREFVCDQDKEKMRRAGSCEFLQSTLSAQNPVYDIDFRRIYPDGLQWVRSRFSIAELCDGKVTKVIFANMNINDQKLEEIKTEEQNRNALMAAYEAAKNANDAKSSFLAQMSHDIRTPMNAIIGMTAIASDAVDDTAKVRDCLNKIDMSSHHLLSLINEILDMSKIEKGKMELNEAPFNMEELFNGLSPLLRTQATQKKQQLTFEMKDISHVRLIGDEARLRQILVNLLSNAVKYTPEGGSIHVTVQEFSGRMPGCVSFVFTVEDNGIGIPEDFLDYIFVPFSRADDPQVRSIQGTGLGMAIAHGIVSAMQGDIQAESKLGEGSRFRVTLSLRIAGSENDKASDGQSDDLLEDIQGCHRRAEGTGRKLSLLLVEDNALNMEIASTILTQSGYHIIEAVNGLEALKLFKQSKPGDIDAILMDLQMPVMDGYTATREIRSCDHPCAGSIPIIALTANAFAEDMAKALAAGMNDHISKPIDYQRLYSVLDKLTGTQI